MQIARGLVIIGVCSLWFAVPAACSNQGSTEVAMRPLSDGSLLETSHEPDADGDAQVDGQSPELDGAFSDAEAIRLDFGVTPRTNSGEGGAGGDTGSADDTFAELETLAVGSRARSLVVRWDSLVDATGVPRDAEFAALGQVAALYRERGRSVLFSIAVVDGTLDARPATLKTSWTSIELHGALDAVIDRTFTTFGSELRYLSFGRDVDRFLASVSSDEQNAASDFLSGALVYARAHSQRPSATQVATAFSLAGLASKRSAQTNSLLAASDLAIIDDLPLDATFHALAPQAAVNALGALPTALAGSGLGAQIVVQGIGYPSSTVAGSSPSAQQQFFQALTRLLDAHRERFPFVAIDVSADAQVPVCAERAQTYGAATDPFLTASLCSLGLTDSTGAEKPAWAEVLAALSLFGKP